MVNLAPLLLFNLIYIKIIPAFRLLLTPTKLNGLNLESHIMVDKISAIRSDKIQKKIGELSPKQLEELIEAIKSWMN